MVDINLYVPSMVEDLIRLEPYFPEIVSDFPLGILTPIDNGSGVILSGEERLTPAAFQIDVYDTSQQRCEELSVQLAARLVSRGFVRGAGGSLKEDRLFRHTLTFFGTIDEHTGMIYRR